MPVVMVVMMVKAVTGRGGKDVEEKGGMVIWTEMVKEIRKRRM